MLVLSRKIGQRIIIGSGVEITIVQIRGNKVRLGVSAPPHISINRVEVWNQIQEEHGNGRPASALHETEPPREPFSS